MHCLDTYITRKRRKITYFDGRSFFCGIEKMYLIQIRCAAMKATSGNIHSDYSDNMFDLANNVKYVYMGVI